MKEEAVAAGAATAGLSLIAGSLLGLPLVAIFAGFWGGIVAIALMEPDTQRMGPWAATVARVLGVLVSTVTAAFCAPYIAQLMHRDGIDSAAELQMVAFVTGAGAFRIMRAAVTAIVRRIAQLGGAA